jgi:hypothetical protein
MNIQSKRPGFPPDVWGPHLWMLLGCIARFYPLSPTRDDVFNHCVFISSLPDVLPCKGCRDSLKEYFTTIKWELYQDRYLQDRTSFSMFINCLHNHVNTKTNKQQFEFQQHVDKFESYRRNLEMDPRIWGPSCWLFLDILGRCYPISPDPIVESQHIRFISSLPHVLPCARSRSIVATVLDMETLNREFFSILSRQFRSLSDI